jgi:N-acetylmuramoyl-L-alanine amidase
MGSIIIANKHFDIDANVINYQQPPYWDATKEFCVPTKTEAAPPCTRSAQGFGIPYGKLASPYTKRYSLRPALRRFGMNPPLDAVKAVIKQFVLHHDGCATADMCWNVLQNERGLSCHFLIDNDGTIYQTIDLALAAWHAGEYNSASIGVEFCNRGDAKLYPTFYENRSGPARDVKACKINRHTYLAFDFTIAQYQSFERLAKALTKLLPNIPVEYPQSSPGEQSWDTLSNAFSYAGYLGHYHCTSQKWDPGPFDLKKFCQKLRGTFCFPLFTREDPKRSADARPEIPKRSDELKEMATALYKSNEVGADGGFFPVGPWGEHRLWHGGVHLAGKENQPLFAPFPGRLVAARMGPPGPVGSNNFVLIRHDMSVGPTPVRFFSLFMHLADGSKTTAQPAPAWLTSDAWKAAYKPGEVVLLEEPIEAGQLIGHMGLAGPDDLAKAQIHAEIFATTPIFTEQTSSPWQLIDGTSGERFCNDDSIKQLIDTNKDGLFNKTELATYYASGDASLYFKVTYHVSEWTESPNWSDALRVPKEFRSLRKEQVDELVQAQIIPGLWWTQAVARHAMIPLDGVVYHYHPVTFWQWVNQKIIEASAVATHVVNANEASETPAGVTDDGDPTGAHMRSEEEVVGDPCDTTLNLEQMVLGFDAPECTL